jgi:hypothetical protein
MIGVLARAFRGETLSFAVPTPKFERMVRDMDESFLITRAWDKVRARLV